MNESRTPRYRNPTDFFVSVVRNADAANKLADEYALQSTGMLAALPATPTHRNKQSSKVAVALGECPAFYGVLPPP